MKQPAFFASASAAVISLLSISNAIAAGDAKGIWMDDTGRGAVEIKACGTSLCGHVVAVKNANDTKGCGKQIIGDVQSSGNGIWDGGWIYSPEKRKNYDVELKPLSDGTLRVVGYAGTKLFSRTMIWTRAPGDLKRCDTVAAAVTPPAPAAVGPASPTLPAVTGPKPEAKVDTNRAAAAAPAPEAPKAAATPAAAAPPLPRPAAPVQAKTEPAKPVEQKNDQAAKIETPPPAADKSAGAPQDEANSGDSEDDRGGEKPGERSSRGGLKIGDLDLDKVLTRTKSGKCKLDLPWVKVQFECERD